MLVVDKENDVQARVAMLERRGVYLCRGSRGYLARWRTRQPKTERVVGCKVWLRRGKSPEQRKAVIVATLCQERSDNRRAFNCGIRNSFCLVRRRCDGRLLMVQDSRLLERKVD